MIFCVRSYADLLVGTLTNAPKTTENITRHVKTTANMNDGASMRVVVALLFFSFDKRVSSSSFVVGGGGVRDDVGVHRGGVARVGSRGMGNNVIMNRACTVTVRMCACVSQLIEAINVVYYQFCFYRNSSSSARNAAMISSSSSLKRRRMASSPLDGSSNFMLAIR